MSAALHSMMHAIPTSPPKLEKTGDLFNFIGVGATGALAYVVLSSALVWLHTGVADWLVNAASYAVLILPVYMMHHRYSFSTDAAHSQALPRYLAVQGMALVLATAFSYGAHEILALPTLLASIAVVVLTASVNYVVLRSWAFAHRRTRVMLAV
jgi:putative flippase GtrA